MKGEVIKTALFLIFGGSLMMFGVLTICMLFYLRYFSEPLVHRSFFALYFGPIGILTAGAFSAIYGMKLLVTAVGEVESGIYKATN